MSAAVVLWKRQSCVVVWRDTGKVRFNLYRWWQNVGTGRTPTWTLVRVRDGTTKPLTIFETEAKVVEFVTRRTDAFQSGRKWHPPETM